MTRVVVAAMDEHYLRKARPVGGIVHLREAQVQ